MSNVCWSLSKKIDQKGPPKIINNWKSITHVIPRPSKKWFWKFSLLFSNLFYIIPNKNRISFQNELFASCVQNLTIVWSECCSVRNIGIEKGYFVVFVMFIIGEKRISHHKKIDAHTYQKVLDQKIDKNSTLIEIFYMSYLLWNH